MLRFKSDIAAVVCGASQGIGREIAKTLASQNVEVLAVSRTESKLQSLVEELKTLSQKDHTYFSASLDSSKDLSELSDFILSKNKYSILICNSGGPKAGPLMDASFENLEQGFKNHIVANQKLLQSVLPFMTKSNWGRVINILSTSVKVPIPNLGVSNTIRGAVAQWGKTLSLELGDKNITVNNILPGYTETERLTNLITAASTRLEKTEDEIIKLWKGKVPMRRFAKPQEVADATVFLCSENANYISGINLPVDGGRTGTL